MKIIVTSYLRALSLALCLSVALPAGAVDAWPSRTVHAVVPYTPGGTLDLLARYLADRLSPMLGQSIIVENRPGAGGNIGAASVSRATPDGYTLLFAGNPTHSINPHLYENVGFDAIKGFTHIALTGAAPNLLVVNPSLAVQTVQELLAAARKNPQSITFASAGTGLTGHLAGELLKREAGVSMTHVPYNGLPDAVLGVMRGDVSFAFVTIPAALPHVRSGKLRAIAITSAERSPLVPEVPTVSESGLPGFEVLAWYNLSAPPKLPPHIISRIINALAKIMAEEGTREKLAALGLEPRFQTGAKYKAFLANENIKWERIIKDNGLVAE